MALVTTKESMGIATVVLNREEALNALNAQMLMELREALIKLEAAKVVVLRGAGDRAFVAGADIKAMSSMSPSEARAFAELGQGVIQLIEQAPFVSVAAVSGFALGGGLELALACDLICGTERAKFALPETNLGLIPGFGGTVNLVRRIGFHFAMEMILTGETIDAQEAYRRGLLLEVIETEKFEERLLELTTKLSKKGIYSLLASRRLVRAAASSEQDRALLLERESFGNLFSTGEPQEGMRAFLEKRSPQFDQQKK